MCWLVPLKSRGNKLNCNKVSGGDPCHSEGPLSNGIKLTYNLLVLQEGIAVEAAVNKSTDIMEPMDTNENTTSCIKVRLDRNEGQTEQVLTRNQADWVRDKVGTDQGTGGQKEGPACPVSGTVCLQQDNRVDKVSTDHYAGHQKKGLACNVSGTLDGRTEETRHEVWDYWRKRDKKLPAVGEDGSLRDKAAAKKKQ